MAILDSSRNCAERRLPLRVDSDRSALSMRQAPSPSKSICRTRAIRESAQAARKKTNRMEVGLLNWWSRRESNPRPQVLYRQFYILSLMIWFNRTTAHRQAVLRRATYCLMPCKVTLRDTISLYMTLRRLAPSGPGKEPVQSPAGIKRLERSCRRWRLLRFQMDLRGDWSSVCPA